MPDASNDAPIKRLIVEKDGPVGRIKFACIWRISATLCWVTHYMAAA